MVLASNGVNKKWFLGLTTNTSNFFLSIAFRKAKLDHPVPRTTNFFLPVFTWEEKSHYFSFSCLRISLNHTSMGCGIYRLIVFATKMLLVLRYYLWQGLTVFSLMYALSGGNQWYSCCTSCCRNSDHSFFLSLTCK